MKPLSPKSPSCAATSRVPEDAEHVNRNEKAIALGYSHVMSATRLAGTGELDPALQGSRRLLATIFNGVGQLNALALARVRQKPSSHH